MVLTPPIEFPFAAVAGQENLKLALTLVAINPLLGGVLISGPRGSAKSTLARGLASVLPDEKSPFVTLPLGTSEEHLLGTLDLNRALNDKEVAFHPGLLSKAHGGVLYVDEVNLLADNLVDQLLDVVASGVNRIERDGISHEHASKFILVGTMNPDEGELRSQLQDRFGLMVSLGNHYSLEERIQIVKRREEFDQDPVSFCHQYQDEQRCLKQQIHDAQKTLSILACGDDIRLLIARCCQSANVDGMRADIIWLRAAMAAAALRGSNRVEQQDVERVEELVLVHRRHSVTVSTPKQNFPDSDGPDFGSGSGSGSKKADSTDSDSEGTNSKKHSEEVSSKKPSTGAQSHGSKTRRPQNSHQTDSSFLATSPTHSHREEQAGKGDRPFDSQSGNQADSDEEWGSMTPLAQTTEQVDLVSLIKNDKPSRLSSHLPKQRDCKVDAGKQKGEFKNGYRAHALKIGKQMNWYKTLVGAALKDQWPPQQAVYKKAKTGQKMLHLILLDTSASTLNNALFAKAKGIIFDIARQSYLKREQIAIFAFGNDKVTQISPQIRAPKDVSYLLDELKAGGGTPFRDALLYVQTWLEQFHKKTSAHTGQHYLNHTYIVTDGRTKADVSDIRLIGSSTLIDTEMQTVKRGRGSVLAHSLGAHYIQLEA